MFLLNLQSFDECNIYIYIYIYELVFFYITEMINSILDKIRHTFTVANDESHIIMEKQNRANEQVINQLEPEEGEWNISELKSNNIYQSNIKF